MKVEIFGASWCTSCKQVVKLCENNLVDFDYIDIDDTASLRMLEGRMGTKVRSVPQIFLNGEHVQGGITELNSKLRVVN